MKIVKYYPIIINPFGLPTTVKDSPRIVYYMISYER